MPRQPFDTAALRQWAAYQPRITTTVIASDQTTFNVETVEIDRARWNQMVADLTAAADEIDELVNATEQALLLCERPAVQTAAPEAKVLAAVLKGALRR
jgi:hypothetical protein